MLHRVNDVPIVLHVDDDPTPLRPLIQAAYQPSDLRVTVVGPLALGVGVMNEDAKPWSARARRPLEHLEIAVGVAKCDRWPAADDLIDADRLAGLVVDEVDIGEPQEHGHARSDLVFR